MIKAKIIFRKKGAILLEVVTDGSPSRFIVPFSEVQLIPGNSTHVEVSNEIIDQSIPYGISWELRLSDKTILASTVADNMRKNGLWTADDIVKNPSGLHAAILASVKELLSEIMTIVKKEHKGETV